MSGIRRPPVDFPNYAAGAWGPEDAGALVARDGHNWIADTILAPAVADHMS
jgi:glucose-6-phosphate 1-dehydrogenase